LTLAGASLNLHRLEDMRLWDFGATPLSRDFQREPSLPHPSVCEFAWSNDANCAVAKTPI